MSSSELAVTVAADDVPPLSAAVEVAAYRIASEALTNTARHAGARHAGVRLVGNARSPLVEVSDDGTGIDPAVTAGVGLRSIRERVEELGDGPRSAARPPEALVCERGCRRHPASPRRTDE